jgi:hypothetical protein
MRTDRLSEEARLSDQNSEYNKEDYRRLLDAARTTFPAEVAIGTRDFFPTSALEGKVTPPDASGGGGCACSSVKNYSKVFTLSPGAASVFKTPRPHTASAGTGGTSTGGGTGPAPSG